MAKRRGQGFLWAFIFAVVSFFIIFLFMPEKSQQFFGTSLGNKGAKEITNAASEVTDAINSVKVDKIIKGK